MGLTAGICARLSGYEADIYEKNPVAEGQCMGWNRRGCHIDNCIHWLTGTKKGTALRGVWETVGALDEHTEFADCDSFYTSIAGDSRATLWKDLERTEVELLRLSPEDEKEIKKFIEHVKYAAECEIPAEKPMDAMGIADYIRMGASMADMPKVMKEYGSIDLQETAGRCLRTICQRNMLQVPFLFPMPLLYPVMARSHWEVLWQCQTVW